MFRKKSNQKDIKKIIKNVPSPLKEKGLKKPNIFVVLLFVFAGWLLLSSLFSGAFSPKPTPFSDLIVNIEQEKVEKIEFDGTKVKAYLKDGSSPLITYVPQNTDFLTYLSDKGLDKKVPVIEVVEPVDYVGIFSGLLNLLIFGVFLFFIFSMFRGRGGGGPGDIFSFGKSRAKLFDKTATKKTTFKDVAVAEEIKKEMYEIVDFLKHPKKYRRLGARIPKGALLIGPPGVGKTLIARAIAGEANVPFYSVAGSEFMEMLVGVGSARVRDLFKKAKATAPSLIFIDEIDSIGRQRGMGIGGGHDEREQTLNQILVEMDGFDKNTNVIVLAATNRPDMLDPALVRPGRFDRKITLTLPTLEERKEIIKIHLRGVKYDKNLDIDRLAKMTVGFSGADIENMINEAAILAARENQKSILFKHFSEASVKVRLGPQRRLLQDEYEKEITAYHEAGHAIVAHFLPKTDPVRRISIVARTNSLGHTDIASEKDYENYDKEKLEQMIAMMLGGRVAEELFFKEQSVGASNDIERATDIARKMVTEFGMSKLGPINFSKSQERIWIAKQLGRHIDYSEKTAEKIDEEVSNIILNSKKMAEKVIKTHKALLEKVAKKLLEVETLEQDEFESIVGKKQKRDEKKRR